MSKLVASLILLVASCYLCYSANVTLTHRPYTNNSNILMNCSYSLKSGEYFRSLNLTKDNGYWFYSYDNSSKLSGGKFRSIAGVNKVNILSPGVFVIPNVNRTTGGNYNCSLNYNIGKVASKVVKIQVN